MLAVLGALVANGVITILKFFGAVMTGSFGYDGRIISLAGGHDESGLFAVGAAVL